MEVPVPAVGALLEQLTPAARPYAAPPLIVVAGLPASGKSYLSRLLAEHLGIAHIPADLVRMAITNHRPRYSAREAERTLRAAAELTEQLLADGHGVVIDAISLTRRARSRYLRRARGLAGARVIIWCSVDEQTAATRLALRAAGADPADWSRADQAERARQAATLIEPPTADEGELILTLDPAALEQAIASICTELAAHRHPELAGACLSPVALPH